MRCRLRSLTVVYNPLYGDDHLKSAKLLVSD
jgi:hypothetical protein